MAGSASLRVISRKFSETRFRKTKRNSAETLAAKCAPNDADADDKLDKVLRSIGLDAGTVLNEARAHKARGLVQDYVRRDPAISLRLALRRLSAIVVRRSIRSISLSLSASASAMKASMLTPAAMRSSSIMVRRQP